MARVAVAWGVRDLAREAGISTDTVARLERGEALKDSTLAVVQATLEAAGVDFVDRNGAGPGVRLMRNFGRVRAVDERGVLVVMELPPNEPADEPGNEPADLDVLIPPETLAAVCGSADGNAGATCFQRHRRRFLEAIGRLDPGSINARKKDSGPMVLQPGDVG